MLGHSATTPSGPRRGACGAAQGSLHGSAKAYFRALVTLVLGAKPSGRRREDLGFRQDAFAASAGFLFCRATIGTPPRSLRGSAGMASRAMALVPPQRSPGVAPANLRSAAGVPSGLRQAAARKIPQAPSGPRRENFGTPPGPESSGPEREPKPRGLRDPAGKPSGPRRDASARQKAPGLGRVAFGTPPGNLRNPAGT